jgi:hypothetical protein
MLGELVLAHRSCNRRYVFPLSSCEAQVHAFVGHVRYSHVLHDGPVQCNSPKTFLPKLCEIAAASQRSKNVHRTNLDQDTVVS